MVTVRTDLANLRESARRIRVEEDGNIVQNNVQKALETLDSNVKQLQNQVTPRTQRAIRSSADLPIVSTDSILNVTISTGLTVTIPAASGQSGLPLRFEDVEGNWAANNVTFNRTGSDTFDGATSVVADLNFGWIEFTPMNDGVNTGYKVRGIYR